MASLYSFLASAARAAVSLSSASFRSAAAVTEALAFLASSTARSAWPTFALDRGPSLLAQPVVISAASTTPTVLPNVPSDTLSGSTPLCGERRRV
jgi:hypothetical protein